jgi:Domain of unknown function (DUF4335)
MDSNNLTTQTYAALTCKLIVSTAEKQNLGGQHHHTPVDFILHLDDPDRADLDRITLEGQFHQLDRLQQVISKYITELVAKFPLPIMNNTKSDQVRPDTVAQNQELPTPAIDTENSIGDKLHPTNDRSGLMNNLPGLRRTSTPPTATDADTQQNPAASSGISKLFGGWNKQNQRKNLRSPDPKQPHTPLGAAASVKLGLGKHEPADGVVPVAENSTPSLTGQDGSLDHQLHLGDLATAASGETVTLSPIQLLDLSTVVDEYAAADLPKKNNYSPSAIFSRANIPGDRDRFTDTDPTTASLSTTLPNLPRTSTGSKTSQVYNQTRRNSYSSNFSFVSVIPWAAAAAVAVGGSLLLLDSKPNPLKTATSNIKMPDLEGMKKTVTTAMSPPVVDPEPTNVTATTTANADLPKPWETQAVQPPETKTKPVNIDTQPTQPTSKPLNTNTITQPVATGKIGIAPLPATIAGSSGQDLPTNNGLKPSILSVLPRNGAQSGIAPNPLSASQLPSETSSIIGNNGLRSTNQPPVATAKSGLNTSRSTSVPVTPGKTTGLPSGKTSPAIKPGTVSVSTQPILLPADLPGIGIQPTTPPQMPSNPVGIDSAAPKAKTAKPKVKPTVAPKISKLKTDKSTGTSTVRQPLFETAPPVQTTPIYVNPEQPQTNTEITDFQNLPVVGPTQPFPSSSIGDADSPSLQESKRYFQSKWKASSTQSIPLQYVVQVSGKTGIVRSIAPQGEAATTYLQQSKLIKTGQKLVSPAAAGSADQKIRVVLQTDGNVDTFMEP